VTIYVKKMPHDVTDFEHTLREFHEAAAPSPPPLLNPQRRWQVAEWVRLGRPLGWDPKLWVMPPEHGLRSWAEAPPHACPRLFSLPLHPLSPVTSILWPQMRRIAEEQERLRQEKEERALRGSATGV
jgi:hypothetical protein